MEIPLYIVAIVVLILLSAFFSATETAFSSLNKIRLRNMAENKDKRSRMIVRLSDKYDNLISTILIGNNLVNIVATTLSTILFAKLISNGAVADIVSTVVMTVAVLIFGEITPKTIAKRSPEYFARAVAPVILAICYLFYPLNWLFGLWQKLVGKIFKQKDDSNITDEELITIVDEAQTEGGLDAYEGELIRSAIEFDDLTVMDVLTPRVEVEAIEYDEDMAEVLKTFRDTGYSRLPVYKDSIDTIVGVLNEKDFYKAYLDGAKNINKIVVKNVIYATPRMKISILLRRLQKAKTHIAIVVDEFGGTMGIATLEDILEELVGEIWDEHDDVVEDFTKVTDDKYIVIGDANLEDFFEFFHVNEDEVEYEPVTVSGFLVMQLGRVPAVGDVVTFENLTMTVKGTEYHKVTQIEVVIETPDHADESQDADKSHADRTHGEQR